MRIALLGAGIIGTVVGRDLKAWDPPEELVVGDLDADCAAAVADESGAKPRWWTCATRHRWTRSCTGPMWSSTPPNTR